jgi:alpha-glucosidase
MRWTPGHTAGFCPPGVTPWLPVGEDIDRINVKSQSRDPSSMLSLMRALLDLRRAHPALSTGRYEATSSPDGVVAFLRISDGERFLTAVNTTAAPAEVPVRAGVVRASTGMDRAGTRVAGTLTLDADEACVLQVATS